MGKNCGKKGGYNGKKFLELTNGPNHLRHLGFVHSGHDCHLGYMIDHRSSDLRYCDRRILKFQKYLII